MEGRPTARISFRCQNPAHARIQPTDRCVLTIHDGLWAYCPSPDGSHHHEWIRTSEVTWEDARQARPRV